MKIGEFAALNHVTPKLLRHYDEIGLLKPAHIDAENGYRSYEPAQSHRLDWILILRNLDFPLADIRRLLDGPADSRPLIAELAKKRREIGMALDDQLGKKMQIDRIILLLEKEGFNMNKHIDLMRFEQKSVHDIKKNMPNMERFLDAVQDILAVCAPGDPVCALRFDISHFKRINDELGFEAGDRVIVACHDLLVETVARFGADATIGRAGGDEFIVFLHASADAVRQTAADVLARMAGFGWAVLGCPYAVNGKIGITSGTVAPLATMRQLIDASYDAMYEAGRKGPGSIVATVFQEPVQGA